MTDLKTWCGRHEETFRVVLVSIVAPLALGLAIVSASVYMNGPVLYAHTGSWSDMATAIEEAGVDPACPQAIDGYIVSDVAWDRGRVRVTYANAEDDRHIVVEASTEKLDVPDGADVARWHSTGTWVTIRADQAAVLADAAATLRTAASD